MAGLAAKALGGAAVNSDDKPAAAPAAAAPERPKIGVPAPAAAKAAEAPVAAAKAAAPAAPPKVSMPTPAAAAPKAKAPTPAPKKPSPPPPKAPKPQKPLDVERLKEEVATAVGGAATGFLVGTYLETQAAASSDEATLTAASGAAVLGLGA